MNLLIGVGAAADARLANPADARTATITAAPQSFNKFVIILALNSSIRLELKMVLSSAIRQP